VVLDQVVHMVQAARRIRRAGAIATAAGAGAAAAGTQASSTEAVEVAPPANAKV